jgi:uncharacterized protein (DUF885 family)
MPRTHLLPLLASVCFTVASAATAPAHAAEPPPSKALAALFEREFQNDLRESPEYATFVGDERYADKLTDVSPAAVQRRRAHAQKLRAQLQAFDALRLNTQDRISRAMMLESLRLTEAFNALYGPLPFNGAGDFVIVAPNGGPYSLYAALAKATPFRHGRDYQQYLARLDAVPEAMAQMTAQMRAGLQSGWVPPREVLSGVPAQFEAFLGEVTANPLYAPFKEFPADMPAADKARLEAAGRERIAQKVQPAFAAMKRFVEAEYIPGAATALGASALPQGKAYYALAVQQSTTTRMTPEQVHELGLAEVARIGGEMDKLLAGAGFKGTRAAYMDQIKADPANYFSKPEDMLRAYRDMAKRVDAELPRLFAQLPRLPYGIRAMDAFEGDNAERYISGALDGSSAGFFEANVLSLKTRPIYDMENTFLHEAVPGHHLQIARAQEIQGLPAFRRSGGTTAYVEGWALYAESLGVELGLYKDTASRFAALAWEMVRACRLVVDTGVHAFGWPRDKAIAYMVQHTGLAEAFATSEVNRYVSSPAQALGYKIGELKIKALRDKARAALGERFDIRRFHNAVLDDGALPLHVLEERIDAWIAAQGKLEPRAKARRTE